MGSPPTKEELQREEDLLRQKIGSKLTVATFLAGFNFTVLALILTLLANRKDLSGNSLGIFAFWVEPHSLLEISTVLFFWSTTLFIAAVYSYDQLLMPRQFRSPKDETSRLRKLMSRLVAATGASEGNREYVYMLSVWYTMFIPATFFSAAGIIVLFYTIVHFKAFVFILGVTFLNLVYYYFFKPRLGRD